MTADIVFLWVRGTISGVLRDLVPFVQFRKREKRPWRSVNFSKVAGFSNFTRINAPLWVFSTFFKLYKWYQITHRITIYQPLFLMKINFNKKSFGSWKQCMTSAIMSSRT